MPTTLPPTFFARPAVRLAAGPALVALVAMVATFGTLAPAGGGPGVTCDELYHVVSGKRLVLAFRHQGPGFFSRSNIERNFPWRPDGPPVHPPLGNWILGWTHHLFDPAPDNPYVVSVAAARFAPVVALGLLVFLVGLWTANIHGPMAGTASASAVVLVPRVFAHGHLASLGLITTLFFTATVLAVAEATRRDGRLRYFVAAGVLLGLTTLVRLHGLLLVPPVLVWVVWRLRRRSIQALAVWGATGAAVFFAGWPWLWLAPVAHFRQFLGTGADRLVLHVFHAGRVWADRDVPWHYTLVMFCVTLPVGLLALGLLGLWAKRREISDDSGLWLAIGTLTFLLALFSWPGVPVYDGVRLFLMAFPLWALAVGVGAKWTLEHPAWRSVGLRARTGMLGLFLLLQGVPLVLYHPCQLSYYNLLTGGLAGAERLGFEVTYWGDSVTEPLLARAAAEAPGEPVLFGPSLAPFQVVAVQSTSPSLADARVELVAWNAADPSATDGCQFGIFYQRKADLDSIPADFLDAEVVASHQIQGVWVARLVRFSQPLGH